MEPAIIPQQSMTEGDYRKIIESLPVAIYTCDKNGYIKLFNQAAVDIWGLEPEIGKDLWCGSWKIYNSDGNPLLFASCQMAIVLKEGRPVYGEEIIFERPVASRRNV